MIYPTKNNRHTKLFQDLWKEQQKLYLSIFWFLQDGISSRVLLEIPLLGGWTVPKRMFLNLEQEDSWKYLREEIRAIPNVFVF